MQHVLDSHDKSDQGRQHTGEDSDHDRQATAPEQAFKKIRIPISV